MFLQFDIIRLALPLVPSTLALCKIYCLQRNCPALWYDEEEKGCILGNVLFADKLNEIVQPPTALEVYADLEMAPASSKLLYGESYLCSFAIFFILQFHTFCVW